MMWCWSDSMLTVAACPVSGRMMVPWIRYGPRPGWVVIFQSGTQSPKRTICNTWPQMVAPGKFSFKLKSVGLIVIVIISPFNIATCTLGCIKVKLVMARYTRKYHVSFSNTWWLWK